MSVEVVACIDPFKKDSIKWIERDGVLLERISRKIEQRYRKFRVTMQVNGKPIPRHNWGSTRAKAGDLVNIKVSPKFGGGLAGMAGNAILGGLSLTALWLLGGKGSSSSSSSSTATNNPISPPPDVQPDPPINPGDGYGGPSDTITPPITGFSNQTNNWGPVPYFWGKLKIYGVKVASEYFLTEGSDQWCYTVLCFGVGPMDIGTIYVGDRTIDDLVAQGLARYEKREGKPGDINTPLTIYTRDVNSVSPGVTLSAVAQVATGGQDANELMIDVVFPNGLYGIDTPTYDVVIGSVTISGKATDFYGDVQQSCQLTVEYRLHGSTGAWSSFSWTVTDQTRARKIASTRWTVAQQGVYDVRVTKVTTTATYTYDTTIPVPNGTETLHHSVIPIIDCNWQSLKSIKSAAPINQMKDVNGNVYPLGLVALAIKASALTNGEIGNVYAVCQRYLKTYNPGSGTWGAAVATSSAAWAFADVVAGFLNDGRTGYELVNAQEVYDANTWCATKNFTYSRILDQFTKIEDLLDDICSHMCASRNNVDGVFRIVIDNTRSAITQIFTPANTNNLEWSAEWPDYPHGLKIKFRNKDVDYNTDERTVYADGYDINNATNFDEYDYSGMTDSSVAWIVGRRVLAAGEQRPIKYSFDVDPQHLVSKRGDLVGLNYDVSFDGLFSGLVAHTVDDGVNVTKILLNQSVVMDAGRTYGVQIRLSDGVTFLSGQIVTNPGEQSLLEFTNPIPLSGSIPARGNVVAFGYLGQEVRQCLVDSIEHSEDLAARITLVDYSPNIQNADQGAIPAYVPNVNVPHQAQVPTITPPSISAVVTDERALLKQAGSYLARIQITLDPPVDAVQSMQAEFKLSSASSWTTAFIGSISDVLYINGVEQGQTYDVRVLYNSSKYPGVSSSWTTQTNITVVGQATPPPDVLEFRRVGAKAVIGYDSLSGVAVPVDWAGFILKYMMATSANWDDMVLLASKSTAFEYDLGKLPQGNLVLGVKAVDAAGNESTNATFIYENISDNQSTFIDHDFINYPESPGWTGTITNGTIVGNELWANDNGSLMYGAGGSLIYPANPSANFYRSGWLSLIYEFIYTPDLSVVGTPFTVFANYHDANGNLLIQADNFVVEYELNSQQRFYSQNGADPMYPSDTSQPIYPADPNTGIWKAFPQEGLPGSRQPYRIRITCFATTANRPKILAGVGVKVAVPTVTEDISQFISGGSAQLAVTKTYRAYTTVQLTLNRDAINYPNADHAQVDFSTTPPTVRVLDISGNPTSGSIFATVKGI